MATPTPDDERVRRAPPERPWRHAPGEGWHGPVPDPPEGLTPAALDAWRAWFSAWWAAFWTPADPERKPHVTPRGRLSAKDRMRIMGADDAPPTGNGAA